MRRALLAAMLACACGRARPAPTVPVVAIDPAPGASGLGDATAIGEAGGAVYVFGPDGVRVIAGGAVVASSAPRAFVASAILAAPDGGGAWIVGVDRDGRAVRVSAAGELEEIGDRFGVAGAVHAIAAAGPLVAFALAPGVAWTDGAHPSLSIDRTATYRAIAAGPGRFAGLGADSIDVWDLAHARVLAYRVPGARAIAFAGDRLVVAGDRALWIEDAGRLAPRAVPGPGSIDALAASGDRAWLVAGGALYTIQLPGGALAQTRGVTVALGARLFPARRGVWMIAAGALADVELDTDADRDARAWAQQIEPVVGRVCARCHLPGGPANVDLSTYASWQAHSGTIRHRVLDTETMPPPGTDLSDADRDAIRRWLGTR
jgi:mono/diheme cytochrome c family protein